MTLIGVAVAVLTLCMACSAQDELHELVATGVAQCDSVRRTSASPAAQSPTGDLASVAIQSKTTGTGESKDCATVSTIRYSKSGRSRVFKVDRRSYEFYYEQSFALIGWSHDSSYLLALAEVAAGDWDEIFPVVLNTKTGKTWRVDVYKLFRAQAPKNCSIFLWAEGFVSGSKLISVYADAREADLSPGEKPCFRKSRWALDFERNRIFRLTSRPKVEALGSVLPRQPNEVNQPPATKPQPDKPPSE